MSLVNNFFRGGISLEENILASPIKAQAVVSTAGGLVFGTTVASNVHLQVNSSDIIALASTGATVTGTLSLSSSSLVINSVTVSSTGTQLNYLNAATGTTGTTSTNVVFSTSPTLVTPVLGVASATSLGVLSSTLYAIGGLTPDLQVHSNSNGRGIGIVDWSNNGARINIAGAKSNAIGTFTALGSGDALGFVNFMGADGSTIPNSKGAQIKGATTQAWSTTTYGAKLEFYTTPNGNSSNTLALTLGSDQSATFAGNISVKDTCSIVPATTGSYVDYCGGSNTTSGPIMRINGSAGSGVISFNTGSGTTCLTLGATQDATFAGNFLLKNGVNFTAGGASIFNFYNDSSVHMDYTGTGTGTAMIRTSGGYIMMLTSTRENKENIKPLPDSSWIYNLKGFQYNYKSHGELHPVDPIEDVSFGWIAEEVAEIFPDIVNYQDGKPFSLLHAEFMPFIVEEMKKLRTRIIELESR